MGTQLVFFIHSASDFGKEFGGDTDVACDLVLGYPLGDLRVFFQELEVAFFCRLGNGGVEALLEDAEGALDEKAEHAFEGGYLLEEQGFVLVVDREQLAVLDGLDEEVGGFLFRKTGQVAYPPVFNGEEEDGLYAFLVDIVASDTAFEDEGFEVADLAFL